MTVLFDPNGRCIPGPVKAKVQPKVRRYFRCEQPEYSLQDIYERSARFIGELTLTEAEFEQQVTRLMSDLKGDPQLVDLLSGPVIPFILPKHAREDIGTLLQQKYLPAVASAFGHAYPDYEFVDHNKTPLAGRLRPAANTGHQELLQRQADRDLVGLYCPAMDGYSLGAAREQISLLPQHFSLAGAADTCAALVACPGLLMREDGYTPLLWFGALETDDPNEGFHLEAYGYNLNFNRRMHLGNADEYWANGLVYCK
ncbi:hypothetical protein [Neptuniibacter halophilus]|uniref:hypothetical protein n=1 Tax=Neptuniibacter halophilus TaxID=651666 RepID=UPI00257485BF|nr:hypothetical protein [Neptuniibacter halophilus]